MSISLHTRCDAEVSDSVLYGCSGLASSYLMSQSLHPIGNLQEALRAETGEKVTYDYVTDP